MRIALLSYELPPETGFGGIGTYTWYQARALVRLGHEVHVIAGSTRPGIHHGEVDGVQITRVAERAFLDGAIEGMLSQGLGWAPNRLQTAAGAYVVLRDLLEHEAFDVVEYPECGGDGILVATLLPVTTCVRFHSPARLIMESYGAADADVEATSFLEQIAIAQADLRIAPSRFMADEVVDRLQVPPPVHVVPNGLDLELFDVDDGIDVCERFGLPRRDVVTVLFSSRLERRKGAHLLPEICEAVLARYGHVHIVLAGDQGDGTLLGEVDARASAIGQADRVHALGRVELAEVRALLKHVDIHLLPAEWDNAPYTCIEAMAAGCALVASDRGGLPELVVDGRTGLVAPAGEAAGFTAAIGRLVEDPDLRDRLGDEARRVVERDLTDVVMARRSIDLWRGTATDV